VPTDENGDFGPIEIWINISAGSQKNYGIVVDNRNGVYNDTDDGIDSATAYGSRLDYSGLQDSCGGVRTNKWG